MIKHRIICNVKENTITHEMVEDNTPIWVDYDAEIEVCKQRLAQTDYIAIKIAEGAATCEDYADMISMRTALRERIGELERLAAEQRSAYGK